MNPCSDKLTDIEYLKHMIPHHQVAIDMSLILQKTSKSPEIQILLRKLIWVQSLEIEFMKKALLKLPKKISSSEKMTKSYVPILSDYIKPNFLEISNTYCDPQFFNPHKHAKHSNKHISYREYIDHMIPHHQVAIDMSKKLLKNTNNDFMIYLAYRIIYSQSSEILLLSNLINSTYLYESDIL